MDHFLSQKLANGQVEVCNLKCTVSSWQVLTSVFLSKHLFLSHYLILWNSESDALNRKATVSSTHSSRGSLCPYVHTILFVGSIQYTIARHLSSPNPISISAQLVSELFLCGFRMMAERPGQGRWLFWLWCI